MIHNERQYRITSSQLRKFEEAVDAYDMAVATEEIGCRELAEAGLAGLKSQVEVFRGQLREYEDLRSGKIKVLEAEGIEELPILLVRARIARGLTQADLAKNLGLKEQQIQRYEAEEYASASLSRLEEVAEALQLRIREFVEL